MKRFWIWFGLICNATTLLAQNPQVPHSLTFADIKLTLTDGARREIQADVDALLAGGQYLQEKADRARLYMPIVEQILREEGVPEDFKYLVIQESAFVPDAVSTSNAIGFWQFKEPSAMEVGLKINRQVDERMNIVSATRGACRYLKKFNETFDNWWFSLQAYNNGLTGATQVLPASQYGSRAIRVNTNSHWYVKKYLAHRIAYYDAVQPEARPKLIYALHETQGGENWRELSQQLNTEEAALKPLNVWLKANRVPEDQPYYIVYPIENPSRQDLQALSPQENNTEQNFEAPPPSDKEQYPVIMNDSRVANQPFRITINGKRAIVAGRFDDINTLASKVDLLPGKLRELNDLGPNEGITPGQYYYLENKRNRGRVYYHTVQPNETLWDISQKYGVKLEKLLQKNRMESVQEAEQGMVLWLRFIRPADIPVQYEEEVRQRTDPRVAHNEEMLATAMAFLEDEEVVSPAPEIITTTPTVSYLPPSTDRPPEESPLPDTTAIEPPSSDEETSMESPQPRDTTLVVSSAENTAVLLYPSNSDTTPTLDTIAEENKVPIDSLKVTPPSVGTEGVGTEIDSLEVSIPEEFSSPALYPAPVQAEPNNNSLDSVVAVVDSVIEDTNTDLTILEATPQDMTPEVPVVEESDNATPLVDDPEPIRQSPQATVPIVHQVQQGETLYGIARKYEVAVNRLAEANQISMDTPIDIDQKLIIPSANSTNTENTTSALPPNGELVHDVQAGETMYAIARKYGVKVEDIRAWNEKEDYTLKVGEKLIIKR